MEANVAGKPKGPIFDQLLISDPWSPDSVEDTGTLISTVVPLPAICSKWFPVRGCWMS